jgi:hypothetical protein
MPRLRIEQSIERIAVALTQFARDEQWLHLNWQRTQTVGECLIGRSRCRFCLDGDSSVAPATGLRQQRFSGRLVAAECCDAYVEPGHTTGARIGRAVLAGVRCTDTIGAGVWLLSARETRGHGGELTRATHSTHRHRRQLNDFDLPWCPGQHLWDGRPLLLRRRPFAAATATSSRAPHGESPLKQLARVLHPFS